MTSQIASRVVVLGLQQHGLLTRADLAAHEVSRGQLGRLRRDGVLTLVTPNVFLVGAPQPSWEQTLRIALLEAGPTAALGFAAAGAWWEAPRLGRGAVEVVLPRWAPRPARTVGRVHQSRDLSPSAVTTRGGLRVTTPARTVLDLAPRIGPTLLDEIVQDLCRRELLTVEQLQEHLETWRRPGRRGIRRLEELIASLAGLPQSDSWLEARFLNLLRDHGLPLPRTQVPIEVDGHRYRVDALWDDAFLICELNGHATHSTRAATSYDAERAARLGTLGYEVIVFTHDQVVGRPRYVVAQIGRRLFRTAGLGQPA